MRLFGLPLTGLITLSLLLAAPAARAQQGGMGLDLSGSDSSQSDSNENQDTPAAGEDQAGGIGLDLSGEVAHSELLPHVVLLGLDTPERAGAAVAVRWLRGLYVAARSNEQWVLSSPLKEVREKLGSNYATALRCAEASCLAEPADTLEADLLVTARLALEDDGWTFRLWTYNRDRNKVETDVVTGRSPKDVKFQKAGAELLAQRLKGLARKRATLAVKVNVPQAVVRLGEKTLGVGSLERTVPPGDGELVVEADEFTPYKKALTLKPGEKQSVEVYLQSSAPSPEGPSEVAEATKQQEKPSAAHHLRPAGALHGGGGGDRHRRGRRDGHAGEEGGGPGAGCGWQRHRGHHPQGAYRRAAPGQPLHGADVGRGGGGRWQRAVAGAHAHPERGSEGDSHGGAGRRQRCEALHRPSSHCWRELLIMKALYLSASLLLCCILFGAGAGCSVSFPDELPYTCETDADCGGKGYVCTSLPDSRHYCCLPEAEVCNHLDDDCNGAVDDSEGGPVLLGARWHAQRGRLPPGQASLRWGRHHHLLGRGAAHSREVQRHRRQLRWHGGRGLRLPDGPRQLRPVRSGLHRAGGLRGGPVHPAPGGGVRQRGG